MMVTKLLRVGRNVANLEHAARFYADILDFEAITPVVQDAALAQLLGVRSVRVVRMRLGTREIELSQCDPAGAPYPADAGANSPCFQHIAIVAPQIEAACARITAANVAMISRHGPVRLPPSSGGVIAVKFRDPDGHPLEFLQFPESANKPRGYDHSAISVADAEKSIAFYARLGIALDTRQINQGREQDALDGLDDVAVEVVALTPPQPAPHLELLCYRAKSRPLAYQLNDLCADRLVFATSNDAASIARDPDGHVILLQAE